MYGVCVCVCVCVCVYVCVCSARARTHAHARTHMHQEERRRDFHKMILSLLKNWLRCLVFFFKSYLISSSLYKDLTLHLSRKEICGLLKWKKRGERKKRKDQVLGCLHKG